jgi:hypothetical protein
VGQDAINEMVQLGKPVVVSHEVCPTDQPPAQQFEYRIKINVYKNGEKIASFGDTKHGGKWEEVVLPLGTELQEQWERIVNMGDIIDEDPSDDIKPPVCRNCGAQVPDTEPQYYFCNSDCEREYDDA